MSFVFELKLGDDTVKRVVFASKSGRRALKTSNGSVVGQLVLTPAGLRLELDDNAAQQIVESDFH
jgi:hypothetical protein